MVSEIESPVIGNDKKLPILVGIDLGSKNTGVVIRHGAHSEGHLFQMDSEGLTISMKERTLKRHQKRGFLRRKLAKRLLRVILKDSLKLNLQAPIHTVNLETGKPNPTQTLEQFFFGCLNRRGFTFSDESEDSDLDFAKRELGIEDLEHILGFSETLGILIKSLKESRRGVTSLYEVVNFIVQDSEKLKQIARELNVKRQKDKKIKRDDAFEYIKDQIKHAQNTAIGKKHRKVYLEEIRVYIKGHLSQLSPSELKALFLTPEAPSFEALGNLAGNISNLQLRLLRKYFNNPSFSNSRDQWQPNRFHKIYSRAITSWHPNGDEQVRKNRISLIRDLESLSQQIHHNPETDPVTQFLMKTNPLDTIPPFEDQNNRRPPQPKTLVLSYSRLEERGLLKYFSQWHQRLKAANPEWSENLPQEGSLIHIANEKINTQKDEFEARQYQLLFIQRILDRSKAHDSYELRRLTRVEVSKVTEELGFSRLKADLLGDREAAIEFVRLARLYYQQLESVRQGCSEEDLKYATPEDALIFEPVSGGLKMKKNIESQLIFARLGCASDSTGNESELDRESRVAVVRKAFDARLSSKSSIKTVAKLLSEIESKEGFSFIKELNLILKTQSQSQYKKWIEALGGKSSKYKLNFDLNHFEEAITLLRSGFTSGGIAFDERYVDSIFDLIHLFNLVFTDRNGFSKQLPWVMSENLWRNSKIQGQNGRFAARCIQLQEMTTRPIDGLIDRIFRYKARAIAHSILKSVDKGWQGDVLISIEENSFHFEQDLFQIKADFNVISPVQRLKSRKKLKNRGKRIEAAKNDRLSRILSSGHHICAYSGKKLSEEGSIEFDHIIPRSYSKKAYQTVFNSEMNLIAVTVEANRKKRQTFYELADLHPKYLKTVFPGLDRDGIEKYLLSMGLNVLKKLELLQFKHLSFEEQNIARHILFLRKGHPEREALWSRAVQVLNTSSHQSVNGTQKYFLQCLKRELRVLSAQQSPEGKKVLSIFQNRVSSDIVAEERRVLAQVHPEFSKVQKVTQSAYSHVIDATLGLSIGLLRHLGEVESVENLLPKSVEIHRPTRRSSSDHGTHRRVKWSQNSWFDDNAIAFHSVPIWISRKGDVQVGFGQKDRITVQSDIQSEFWKLIAPYLTDARGLDAKLGLEELRNRARNSELYFHVDITKYRDIFRQIQQGQILAPKKENDQILRIHEVLSDLVYYTGRKEVFGIKGGKDIESYMTEDSGLGASFENMQKRVPLEFKLSSSDRLKKLTTLTLKSDYFRAGSKKSEVRIPISEPLEELFKFYQDIKDKNNAYFRLKAKFHELFDLLDTTSSSGNGLRVKTRSRLSIPLLVTLQGTPSLIQRRNIFGQDVHQIYVLERGILPCVPGEDLNIILTPLKKSGKVTLLSKDMVRDAPISRDYWMRQEIKEPNSGLIEYFVSNQKTHPRQRMKVDSGVALQFFKEKRWQDITPTFSPKNCDLDILRGLGITKMPRKPSTTQKTKQENTSSDGEKGQVDDQKLDSQRKSESHGGIKISYLSEDVIEFYYTT